MKARGREWTGRQVATHSHRKWHIGPARSPVPMIGFFPTYTIGNAIAAQLMHQLRAEEPALDVALAGGDPKPLLAFLRDRVHRLGSLFSTAELVQRATGAPLSIDALIRHLAAKAALWG